MNNTRIGYIDALRGFTMLLVVFAHIETFSYGIKYNESILGSIIMSFYMPNFFFISGYMAFKDEKYTLKSYINKIKNKFQRLIIPTFILFQLYFTICHNSTIDLIITKGPLGFWFTFTLFYMYIIYYTILYIFNKGSKSATNVILFIIGIIGQIIFIGGIGNIYNLESYPIFTLTNLTRYFVYFIIGILCKQFNTIFIKYISNDKVITSLITIYIISLTFEWNKYLLPTYSVLHVLNFEIFIQYIAIFMIFTIFYHYRNIFTNNNSPCKILCYIGRHTLEIYLIHWFFIPELGFMKEWFINNKNLLAEFFITTIILIAIVLFTIVVSYITKTSKHLNIILWGAKYNNNIINNEQHSNTIR